jgi:hypothetical protein
MKQMRVKLFHALLYLVVSSKENTESVVSWDIRLKIAKTELNKMAGPAITRKMTCPVPIVVGRDI